MNSHANRLLKYSGTALPNRSQMECFQLALRPRFEEGIGMICLFLSTAEPKPTNHDITTGQKLTQP